MEVLLKKTKSKSRRTRSRSLLPTSSSSAQSDPASPETSIEIPPKDTLSPHDNTARIKHSKSLTVFSPLNDIATTSRPSTVEESGRKKSFDFIRSRSKSRSRSTSLFGRASEKIEKPQLNHVSGISSTGEVVSNGSKSGSDEFGQTATAEMEIDDSSKTEVLEYLESLKQASLHALNSLIHRIVEVEASHQKKKADEISKSTEMTQIPVEPAPLQPIPTTPLTRSAEGSQIFIQAAQISDGGQIIAAMNQSQFDRAASYDILRRSAESLHSDHIVATGPLHDDLTSDHGLALALAALCNGLYQIIDSSPLAQYLPMTDMLSVDRPVSVMFTELVTTVSEFRSHRQQFESQINVSARALWGEIDKLMELIQTICRIRQQRVVSPPPYHEAIRMSSNERRQQQQDLNLSLIDVVNSIDRVMNVAPRLFNQTVILTDRQERIMSIAALTGVIDRLNRGRLVDQSAEKLDRLSLLVEQITKAGERRMMDQRVTMTAAGVKKMDEAKLGKIIDRQEKLRMSNQDWESKEQRLLNDLNKLHADLIRIQPSSSLSNNQRFILTPTKERNLYMSGVAGKIGKMAERRMDNQDAKNPSEIRAEDIERMMERMRGGEDLGNQRSPMPSRKREVVPAL